MEVVWRRCPEGLPLVFLQSEPPREPKEPKEPRAAVFAAAAAQMQPQCSQRLHETEPLGLFSAPQASCLTKFPAGLRRRNGTAAAAEPTPQPQSNAGDWREARPPSSPQLAVSRHHATPLRLLLLACCVRPCSPSGRGRAACPPSSRPGCRSAREQPGQAPTLQRSASQSSFRTRRTELSHASESESCCSEKIEC